MKTTQKTVENRSSEKSSLVIIVAVTLIGLLLVGFFYYSKNVLQKSPPDEAELMKRAEEQKKAEQKKAESAAKKRSKEDIQKELLTKDMFTVISERKDVSQFSNAVKLANMEESLRAAGTMTLFVPNNTAFKLFPDDVLADLLKPENQKQLRDFLKYHMSAQQYPSSDITALRTIKSITGQDITVTPSGKDMLVNGAKVLERDIQVSNGVIHIIDAVLVPPLEKPAVN